METETKILMVLIGIILACGLYYFWHPETDDNPLKYVKRDLIEKHMKGDHGSNTH